MKKGKRILAFLLLAALFLEAPAAQAGIPSAETECVTEEEEGSDQTACAEEETECTECADDTGDRSAPGEDENEETETIQPDEAQERTVPETEAETQERGTPCAGTEGIIRLRAAQEPNEYGYYRSDVPIDVLVAELPDAENGTFFGLSCVCYEVKAQVEQDGEAVTVVTQSGVLYRKEEEEPDEAGMRWTGSGKNGIIVRADCNNSDVVTVTAAAYDGTGKVAEDSLVLAIDTEEAQIAVELDDRSWNRKEGERGYYREARTATVTFGGRQTTFDASCARSCILRAVTAVDGRGEETALVEEALLGDWTYDGTAHSIAVTFGEDANYSWDEEALLAYTSKAGNPAASVSFSGNTPRAFTVDRGAPTGRVCLPVWNKMWDTLLQTLTFGLYGRQRVEVTASAEDAISPVILRYVKTDNPQAMTVEQLERQTFLPFEGLTVDPDERFVIYLQIEDYAGNRTYVGTNGVILDHTPPVIRLQAPPAENGIYRSDVPVTVSVTEEGVSSGLRSVLSWIEKDGKETGRETLFVSEKEDPSYGELAASWDGSLLVGAKENDSCDVVVYVRAEDRAGNVSVSSLALDIDVTAPTVTLSYDNNADNGGNGYFADTRTATVTVEERTHHFDEQAAKEGITITAKDGNGKEVKQKEGVAGEWVTEENTDPDRTRHTIRIRFAADANYTLSLSFADRAGNQNVGVRTDAAAPYRFTVDRTPPYGAVTAKSKEGRRSTWTELSQKRTFGFFSAKKITVSCSAADATSPVDAVLYYKESGETPKSAADLERMKPEQWRTFRTFSIKKDEQCAVYVKLVDRAGNCAYLSTDGMILDQKKPRLEALEPQIRLKADRPCNDIYHGDVRLRVLVEDPTVRENCSGLQQVSFRVLCDGEETQSADLYVFRKKSPVKADRKTRWGGSFTVEAAKNNSNNVVVEVTATDRAGNISREKKRLKIDVTPPAVSVCYDNNAVQKDHYYKEERTATIRVSERNFRPRDVCVTITNEQGTVPVLSAWQESRKGNEKEDPVYTAKVRFFEDGDYTLDIRCTDEAGNESVGVAYAPGSTSPEAFTIDRTPPEISVRYDNNAAQNGTYFREGRTAYLTVKEHNFDPSGIVLLQTASDCGTPVSLPEVRWTGAGDVHTAVLPYTRDGAYTFDVKMTDPAGNQSGEVDYGDAAAPRSFTVDTGIDQVSVTGVADGCSYRGEVAPVLAVSDSHFAAGSVQLRRRNRMGEDEDVTEMFLSDLMWDTSGFSGGASGIFRIPENDGIYTLCLCVTDKAGNEERESIAFTVNRFGSVYVWDDALRLVRQSFVREVKQDLVLTEYNPDALTGSVRVLISRDGVPLPDVAYAVTALPCGAEDGEGWHPYEYVIDRSNFAEDGVYRITAMSQDRAGNASQSDQEEDLVFCVDTTAPQITLLLGLEHASVNAAKQEVTCELFDAIGLKRVCIYVDGEPVPLQEDPEGRQTVRDTFFLTEGTSQHVRIVAEDLAGNVMDTDERGETGAYVFDPPYDFRRSVTVSTNFFVRWYADKVLFFGSLSFFLLFGIAVVSVLFRKRACKS